jgi:molybdopterin-guanine dinucleotide biosynthesis protein A
VNRSGLVLAGGRSERMGAPKPTMPFRGRPLVAWSLDALAPLCGELLVMTGAGSDAALAAVVGSRARLVADEGSGPLAALVAGARAARGEWLLVAPCDAPFLTAPLYEELLAAAGRRDGAMASADGVANPLVSVLRREAALRELRAAQWMGARGPAAALRQADVALVPVAPHDVADVDTVEDVRRLGT